MEKTTSQNVSNYRELVFKTIKENKISIEEKARFFLYSILELSEKYIVLSNEVEIEKRKSSGDEILGLEKTLDRKVRKEYIIFSKELIKNSIKETITVDVIYFTLKDLCPIWPFCKKREKDEGNKNKIF